MNDRIARAWEQAQRDAEGTSTPAPHSGAKFGRRIAIGDPQAPLEIVLRILDAHGLLGDDGRLAADVQLVSIGDHFDYGNVAAREEATRDGLAILAWLAAHAPEQTVLLLGNHDLSRVCELARFSTDAQFAQARGEADAVYRAHPREETAEQAFLARHPGFASSESLARDLSTFCVAQRRLVALLLESRRLRIAHAASETLLLVHAGGTSDDFERIGVRGEASRKATQVAAALNGYLDRCVEMWDGAEPFDLQPLHQPQTQGKEGRGIFLQRPTHPERAKPGELEGPPRRRYDPRWLPLGLTQVIGHIRDDKTRELLGSWVEDAQPPEGPLRSVVTDGQRVAYRAAVQPAAAGEARLVFIDGGMRSADPDRYQLLDLDRLLPAPRVR